MHMYRATVLPLTGGQWVSLSTSLMRVIRHFMPVKKWISTKKSARLKWIHFLCRYVIVDILNARYPHSCETRGRLQCTVDQTGSPVDYYIFPEQRNLTLVFALFDFNTWAVLYKVFWKCTLLKCSISAISAYFHVLQAVTDTGRKKWWCLFKIIWKL